MALIKVNNRSSEDTAIHGRRNLIINGAMQVAQRGTSYTQGPNVGNYHTVDRYSYRRSGAWSGVTAVELTQESSGGPVSFKNFLRYAPTGSDATTPNNACMLIDYKVEGKDISQLEYGTSNAKSITISFYVRASVTGTFCLNIRNDDANRQYVKEYTINSANTWERKELTFPGAPSGTWDEDNTTGLVLMWFLSGDTDSPSETGRLVTGNQWNNSVTTNTYTSNQSDALTKTSGNTFDITGIQLEKGNTATPFEHRSFGEELSLCQRYYETSFEGGASTTNSNQAGVVSAGGLTMTNTTSFIGMTRVDYKVSKRAAATVTYYDFASPRNTGKGHRFQLGSTAHNNSNVTIADNSISGFNTYSTGTGAGSGLAFHYEATSEL